MDFITIIAPAKQRHHNQQSRQHSQTHLMPLQWQSVRWWVGRLVGWLVGRSDGWSVGCLVSWSVGELVVGQLVSWWLVGWSDLLFNNQPWLDAFLAEWGS